MTTEPQSKEEWGRLARAGTLLLTWATKLVGLAAAFEQLLLSDNPKPVALAVAAFMMAGAQFSEGLVLTILDKLTMSGSEEQGTGERSKR